MKKTLLTSLFLAFSLINYAQLAWLKMPDFPGSGKRGVASFSINNKGYMGLGLTLPGQGSTDWYEYDPISNTWIQKASLPVTGRFGVVSFVIGNKGYVITGSTGSSNSEAWEYDPINDTWTAKAAYPGGVRESATGFSIGTKGYVGTGYAGNNSFDDFYEFDPVANSWAQKASFPGAARNGAAGFSIGNMGYIGMGNNTNSTSNFQDFYEYDPSTDIWTRKADFPLPYVVATTTYSSNGSAFSLGGYYYQYTGITHNPMNMLYKYDVATDAWTLSGTFPGLPRGYAGGFSLNNDIYIGGGGQTNGIGDLITDVWKLSNGLSLRVIEIGNDPVQLAPNPAQTAIRFIGLQPDKKIENVRIYNVRGELVTTKKINEVDQSFDISKLSSGVYFLEIITSKGDIMNGKFVKQ